MIKGRPTWVTARRPDTGSPPSGPLTEPARRPDTGICRAGSRPYAGQPPYAVGKSLIQFVGFSVLYYLDVFVAVIVQVVLKECLGVLFTVNHKDFLEAARIN